MKDVSHHIVEAYLIHRKLIERYESTGEAKNEKGDATLEYKALEYAKEGDKIIPDASLENFTQIKSKNKNACNIQDFICNLEIKTQSTNQRGITWIEMYILYRLRGYDKPLRDPEEIAMPRSTLDKQIRKFRSDFNTVRSRIWARSELIKITKAGKATKDGLMGVGIIGKLPCLPFNVHITARKREEIEMRLHRLNHACSQTLWNKIKQGQKLMIPRDFKIKGKVEWDNSIPRITQPTFDEIKTTKNLDYGEVANKQITFISCPRCQKSEPNNKIKIQKQNLDKSIKCPHCGKSTATKEWTCPCNTKWYLCEEHSGIALPALRSCIPGRMARSQTATRRNLKRALPKEGVTPLGPGEGSTAKRMRTKSNSSRLDEGMVDLNLVPLKRPRLLGPILAARFGYPQRDM